MNWLASLQLGLLNPYWLALLPIALGGLVFAYFRRGKGQQVKVGTLFLLRSLKRPVFARSKFRPPPRFYFELLLLLLLTLGAAGLYRQGMGTRIAVVIDNSLSMTRVRGGDAAGDSLLNIAIRDAASFVRSLTSQTKVEVFTVGPLATSRSGDLVHPEKAIRDIEAIEFSYTKDNIESAVQKLITSPAYDRVVLFTDHPSERSSQASRLEVRSVAFGSPPVVTENVAISHLAVRTNTPKNTLEVSLAAFLQGSSKLKVIVESVEGEEKAFRFKRIAERPVTMRGKSNETVVFPEISAAVKAFRVRIEPDEQNLSLNFDSIRHDDVGWVSVGSRGGKIAFVSQFSPGEMGLTALKFAQFEHIRPEDYEQRPTLLREQNFAAALFHRYVPQLLPEVSSVFIAPVSGASFFGASAEQPDIEITRWNGTHPVLNYVNIAKLELGSARILTAPLWAEDLISSTRGTLAFAGRKAANTYVAIGFELLPFEGRKSTLTSILTLNIIKYVSEINADSAFQMVNSKLFLPSDAERAVYIDGQVVYRRTRDTAAKNEIVATRPGMIAIQSPLTGMSFVGFNFFDQKESDSLFSEPLHIEATRADSVERRDNTNLAGAIALFIALILVIDLILVSGFLKRLALPRSAS